MDLMDMNFGPVPISLAIFQMLKSFHTQIAIQPKGITQSALLLITQARLNQVIFQSMEIPLYFKSQVRLIDGDTV